MSLITKDHVSLALKSIKALLSRKADKTELRADKNELLEEISKISSSKVDKNELQEELSKISENVTQPDWNQNDPTAPDYVKNRQFYSEIKEITVLPEVSFVTTNRWAPGFGDEGKNTLYDLDYNIEHLFHGCTCDVYFKGTKYECVVELDGYNYMFGNKEMLHSDGYDESMPFLVVIQKNSNYATVYTQKSGEFVTLKIMQTAEVFHKLSSNYIESNLFLVEMTNGNDGVRQVDKTYFEIMNALAQGKAVYLRDNAGLTYNAYIALQTASEMLNCVRFVTSTSSGTYFNFYVITINSDNSVVVDKKTVQL